jgi:hypothetical protein
MALSTWSPPSEETVPPVFSYSIVGLASWLDFVEYDLAWDLGDTTALSELSVLIWVADLSI